MFTGQSLKRLLALAVAAASSTACTKAVTGYFSPLKFTQLNGNEEVLENFMLSSSIAKTVQRYRDVDLLWMVDNSGSMGNHQTALTDGFKEFATTYFTKDRNIRLAAIPSDTYLAGATDVVAKYGPGQGKCYSFLLPGVHDGIRPNIASLKNDCTLDEVLPSARTGNPILETQNSDGTAVDLVKLAADFGINAKVGTAGNGSERGLQSIIKMLEDNEGQASCASTGIGCLFRKNKLRGIILVGDEHSQDIITDGVTTIDHTAAKYKRMTDAEVTAESNLLGDLVRKKLNTFFTTLDGKSDPNYFVVTIANLTCVEIGNDYCGLRLQNNVLERHNNERWGPEYLAVHDAVKADGANSAGALSIRANINNVDFKAVLAQVGQVLDTQVEQVVVTSFTLTKDPSSTAPVRAEISDSGVVTQISQGAIKVTGRVVDIDQSGLPGAPSANARITFTYVPL